MAPSFTSIPISRPKSITYTPLTPYTDDDNALSNNVLCPRYAENDSTSAPPSPASIESFDILDSVAWRQGHSSHSTRSDKVRACDALCSRLQKNRGRVIGVIFLILLLVAGCAAGGLIAWRHENARVMDECAKREGGERCKEITWAKCVAINGFGYCEGIMGTEKVGP